MDIALPLIAATNADGESGMHGFEGHRAWRSAPFAGAAPPSSRIGAW
ncbi:hypothetical protein ACWGQ5_37480 [Streptomyces sp. NPDC055722]